MQAWHVNGDYKSRKKKKSKPYKNCIFYFTSDREHFFSLLVSLKNKIVMPEWDSVISNKPLFT